MFPFLVFLGLLLAIAVWFGVRGAWLIRKLRGDRRLLALVTFGVGFLGGAVLGFTRVQSQEFKVIGAGLVGGFCGGLLSLSIIVPPTVNPENERSVRASLIFGVATGAGILAGVFIGRAVGMFLI